MMSFQLSSRQIAGVIGLAGFSLTLFSPPPEALSVEAWRALGLTWLMAVFWMAEILPLAVTALLPIVLAPALGLAEVGSITRHYGHPLIFLFLGGFMLGLAMERWRLHERIALHTLSAMGGTPARELAGFMLATAFLSMWVSNTATTIMMLPIALSVVHLKGMKSASEGNPYAVALLLGIAYAASIGGIATLIGTPPNALLAAYLSSQHEVDIGFAQWMIIGVPVCVVMLLLTWIWLSQVVARGFTAGTASGASEHNGRELFHQRLITMGAPSAMERRVAVVFGLTAAAWIFQPVLARLFPAVSITDSGIAIACAVLLHALPAGNGKGSRLMDWETSQRLPWGVLLLFGGGLALAAVIQESGLAEAIALQLSVLKGLPIIIAIGIVTLTVIFLTEVTSNTATTAAFLPLLGALALAIGLPVEALAVPAALAASCAFMLPVATPPNAIVFGSGEITIKQMASAGLILSIAGMLVVTLVGTLLVQWGLFG